MTTYAKRLSPSFVRAFRDLRPPWGPVGYVTYKRTYSRRIDHRHSEEWWQTLERACNGILDIGGVFTQDEIERLYTLAFALKCCFSGRALWQLGTPTVERLGGDSLQNCWVVGANTLDAFTFTFNELMLGGGVGFNITPEFVYELPPVKFDVPVERVETFDCDFLVPDNREGWIELLDRILQGFFVTGKPVRYNTFGIRDKGTPIRGFGGIASGAEELVKGMQLIAKILRSARGRKLRPIEVLDVFNIIGQMVVAGNVRRSAEIALGSPQDLEYLHAKDWSRFKVPAWRQHSNNSVITPSIYELPSDFWAPYEGQGEPYGLVNLDLIRRMGRLADGPGYRPDPNVIGVNPCAEVNCESHEACNLFELFLPNFDDINEFVEAAVLGYKVVKTISTLKFIHPKTNEVVGRNHRLGIGVTGFCAAQKFHNPGVFDAVYSAVEEADKEYSKTMRCGESIKLTTVKPSGTLSLLPGVPPGVHPVFAPYYLRRITFAANNPLVDVARDHGFDVEPKLNIDGSSDFNSMIVAFPVKALDGAITERSLSAVNQLENQLFLQTHWADNSVSMTCYYHPSELPAIQEWLGEHYADHVKTASFLRHSGHGFKQAPYEEITAEQYEAYAARTRPITYVATCSEDVDADSLECKTGACPTK